MAPSTTIDQGKVRLGGESPTSVGPSGASTTIDQGKVRLGGESPSLVRSDWRPARPLTRARSAWAVKARALARFAPASDRPFSFSR